MSINPLGSTGPLDPRLSANVAALEAQRAAAMPADQSQAVVTQRRGDVINAMLGRSAVLASVQHTPGFVPALVARLKFEAFPTGTVLCRAGVSIL